jgi:two-component system, cell cycle response regulator
MMSTPQSFTVATVGFADTERRVLRNVLAISEHRAPAFQMYEPSRSKHPHIVVVNADRAEAMRSWQQYLQADAGRAALVTPVFLSRAPIAGIGKYALHRPVVATRLFQLLEQVVTEAHGFAPLSAFDPEDVLVVLGDEAPQASAARTAPAVPAAATSPTLHKTPSQPVTMPADAPAEVVALVIDDSLPVRLQMRSALKSLASHVDFAETGEQGLEFIDKRAYSIIFLDVILPGKDGYEICRRIKRHPLQLRTPVVMLTGNSSPADRVKGKLAGCETYLIKPVKQAVFEQVVSSFVRAPAAA